MPAVKDLWTYGETGFHSLYAAVVQERYGRKQLFQAFAFLVKDSCTHKILNVILTDTAQTLLTFKVVGNASRALRPGNGSSIQRLDGHA